MQPNSSVHLYDVTVVSTEEVAQDIQRTVLSSPELAAHLVPGQFISLAVPGDPSQIVRVPLSYSAADVAAGTLELIYARVGDGTRRLAAMRVGEKTTAVGPCGHGWKMPTASDTSVSLVSLDASHTHEAPVCADTTRVLLVSGGIGVVPIVAAARELARRGVTFDAVIGAQTTTRLWGIRELEALGARVVSCTDDGSCGIRGFSTIPAAQMLAEERYMLVMSCGPTAMMAGIAHLAQKAHVSCQVSLERMMTCGFGACHTCNVAMVGGGYSFCCTDGPVYDACEVAW